MKALMVIDVQNGMFLEEDPVFEGERLLETINGLLTKARAVNVPVFYVQQRKLLDSHWNMEQKAGKSTPLFPRSRVM